MSLTPHQQQVLLDLADHLRRTDPVLARRLSTPTRAPESAWREVAVLFVLLIWVTAGFTPLALGVALGVPLLSGVGVLTSVLGVPVAVWLTVRWVRRHHWVRLPGGGDS